MTPSTGCENNYSLVSLIKTNCFANEFGEKTSVLHGVIMVSYVVLITNTIHNMKDSFVLYFKSQFC